MKPLSFLWAASALSVCLAAPAQGNGTWETVSIDYDPDCVEGACCPGGQCQVTVGGEEKTVEPECALGTPYSFHFKEGKHDKLLIYFNGGGACWDFDTCVGSLFSSQPTYVPYAEIANDPAEMGGILDPDNPENPYADWSMLFVSYCTGDVHTGHNVEYYYGFPINHHGFDNFLYALDWLRTHHPEIEPGKVFTAGSSAGAYGAVLDLPWLHEFYPYTDKTYLLADGGVGVFTDAFGFADAVFGASSVWNLPSTLHPTLASVPGEALEGEPPMPESFMPRIYDRLRAEYPKDKFAQYTTAYDAIQTYFWDIMLGYPGVDPVTWNSEMNAIDERLRLPPFGLSLPDNYRSYIGPGCNHTVLRYDDDFYDSSLEGIEFLEWLTAMTGGKRRDQADWQNLSCANPYDCGLVDEYGQFNLNIGACLSRTFGGP